MNKSKKFTSLNGDQLIIKSSKTAVVFELGKTNTSDYKFIFKFTPEHFKEIFNFIKEISTEIWETLTPKPVTSMGSDYYEYYDRKLDNNGYLELKANTFVLDRPTLSSNKLYQFSKKKMESFIYDYKNSEVKCNE